MLRSAHEVLFWGWYGNEEYLIDVERGTHRLTVRCPKHLHLGIAVLWVNSDGRAELRVDGFLHRIQELKHHLLIFSSPILDRIRWGVKISTYLGGSKESIESVL